MSEQILSGGHTSRMLIQPGAVVLIQTVPIELIDLVESGVGGTIFSDEEYPFVGIGWRLKDSIHTYRDFGTFNSIKQARTAKALILKAMREAKR